MLTGTGPVDEFLVHAATLDGFDTSAVTLSDAEVLQASYEMRIDGRQVSLPPGLHPTNPPTFIAQIWRYGICKRFSPAPRSPWSRRVQPSRCAGPT